MLRLCCAAARTGSCSLLRTQGGRTGPCHRHASSGGAGGAAVKLAAGTVLLSGGAVGGAVAYASVDADFRKLLEDSVPGSDQALELLLGSPAPPPPPPKATPSRLRISSPVVVTKPATKEPEAEPAAPPLPPMDIPPPVKSPEPEVQKVVEVKQVSDPELEAEAKDVKAVVKPDVEAAPVEPEVKPDIEQALEPVVEQAIEPVVEPVVEAAVEAAVEVAIDDSATNVSDSLPDEEIAKAAVVEEAVVVEEAPAVEEPPAPAAPIVAEEAPETAAAAAVESPPEPVAEKVKAKEPITITTDIENSSLETVLEELCQEMKANVEGAVQGYDVSSTAVLTHINIMQKVLESNLTVKDDTAWNEMFEAAVAKSDAAKAAEIKERKAIAAIDNVVESISAGRKNRTTSTNPNLLLAEEAANSAKSLLEEAKGKGSAIQGEAAVMEEYRDLVEAGRQEFQREMASIMPDVKLGEKSGKLTEDELNMFITHAYKKVLFLQQEVAKQQTLEQERFKKALEKQRVETHVVAAEKIESELERQKRDLELEHERRVASIRDEAEAELRAQLRRQAAAHSDHLADVLAVQSAELVRKNEHVLDEKLSAARSEYLTDLASLSGTVSGLTGALTDRAASDRASLRAQGLWLACTGLRASLLEGRAGATDWEAKLLPLTGAVGAIRGVAGEDDFVRAVLGSLSPVALERGVYTEDSLKERWLGVERVARRVANIGQGGGSLFSYGLSYLQSLLLLDLSSRSPSQLQEEVDPATFSPNDLVNLARHSLDRADLAAAVQYVTLLQGEPGRVARDWLEEARLTLEVEQAARALLAHAAVDGARALPRY